MLPTTLLALLSAILLVSGPLHAGWLRFPVGAAPGWASLFPVILSLAWIFSLCTFLTQFAHPWTQVAMIMETTPFTLYSDLYTMHADGTAQTRLTLNPRLDYFGPSWSPDGRKIAFSLGSSSSSVNLYVMNADGTAPMQLTHLSFNCYLQHWSPDGSKLVFIAQQGSDVNTAAVCVMHADGSHLRRLTHEDAREYGATWSPDGQHIAFESNRTSNQEIYVVNADGSGITDLTRNPGVDNILPEWSPDSREITYMAQRQAAQSNASLGIASIIIQAALLVGFILLLVHRWRMPFGALTLLITLNGLLLSMLTEQYVLLPAVVVTGLVADVLLPWLVPVGAHSLRDVLFACTVPMVWSALYFLTLSLTQGMAWSIPLWAGSIVLAGLAGLGLNFLLRLPLFKGE